MARIFLLLASSAIAMASVAAIDTPQEVATGSETDGNALLPPSDQQVLSMRDNRRVLTVFKDKDDEDREGKLLAFYTTKTKAVVVTSTAFALSTCFSTTNMPSCAGGRRRRNIFNDIDPQLNMDSSAPLQASLAEPDSEADSEEDDSKNPKVGRKFTVWSTSFSTYTVVSTSYYQGTTVTVSALCNPGIAASCWG